MAPLCTVLFELFAGVQQRWPEAPKDAAIMAGCAVVKRRNMLFKRVKYTVFSRRGERAENKGGYPGTRATEGHIRAGYGPVVRRPVAQLHRTIGRQ